MAFQDYQVTTAGAKKVMHNGRVVNVGRLVTMDASKPETAAAIARGLITATITTATQHDATAQGPATEAQQTYHVQSGIPVTILHNGSKLATSAAMTVDPLDEPYATFLAKGWIA